MGRVSNHCTEAERWRVKSRNGARSFFRSSGDRSGSGCAEFEVKSAAESGLHSWGPGILLRGSGSRRGYAAHLKMDAIAKALLAAAAAVQVHDDLSIAKFQFGNLHVVAGIHGSTMRGDLAVEHVGVQRLANVHDEAVFAGRQRLDGARELAGDIADQGQLGTVLQSRAFADGLTVRR